MSRPDLAHEPSMEEILASIRKIIAEDTSAERPMPDMKLKTLVTPSNGLQTHAQNGLSNAAAQNAQPYTLAKASTDSFTFTPSPQAKPAPSAPEPVQEKQNGHASIAAPVTAAPAAAAPAVAAPQPSQKPTASFLPPVQQTPALSSDDDLDDLLDDAPAAKPAPLASSDAARPAVTFTRTTIAPAAEEPPKAEVEAAAEPAPSAPQPKPAMPAQSRAFLDAFPRYPQHQIGDSEKREASTLPALSEPLEADAFEEISPAAEVITAIEPEASAPQAVAAASDARPAPKIEVVTPILEPVPVKPQPEPIAATFTQAPAPAATLLGPAPGPVSGALAAAVQKSAEAEAHSRTMEDTVSELLRPLLRQWLSDNMPKIVEKALLSELAEQSRKTNH